MITLEDLDIITSVPNFGELYYFFIKIFLYKEGNGLFNEKVVHVI